ncbi:GRF zinc finger protein [Medicago truncatula]|uniref:GRF zinc finger protein n=1 Tax=Medicago truncatula TaxID=3880 RepID=G7KPI6_MEDTR|nr:GRF zinc finger protein [Medicago truncatula]
MSTVSQNSKTNSTQQSGNSSVSCYGSILRRRSFRDCRCGEKQVLRTVSDVTNPNFGKKNLGCINYKNQFDKGCNYFNWFDARDDIIDAKDRKIEKHKKKTVKLKIALRKRTEQRKERQRHKQLSWFLPQHGSSPVPLALPRRFHYNHKDYKCSILSKYETSQKCSSTHARVFQCSSTKQETSNAQARRQETSDQTKIQRIEFDLNT